jgi:hypothetical protein
MAGGDELDAVLTAIDALPADTAQVPDVVLAERMRQLVAARARLDAVLVEQLAAFDARGAADYDGQTSTRAWLHSRLRLGGQAGELLRVARHLAGLPQTAKAFAAGEISLEHVSLVARLAGTVGGEALAEYEPILVELARQAPPAKLRIACEHVRQLLDPDQDADHAARARRSRYLTAARTIDGMVHLQGLLDAAAGDVVLTALEAATPVPAAYEERTGEQRRVDALVDICAGWLAAGEAPTSGGVRPQVHVTVSLRALQSLVGPLGFSDPELADRIETAWRAAGRAFAPLFGVSGAAAGQPGDQVAGDVPVLADGQPIPAGEARGIACDAGVIPVVMGGDGEVLDIGRASRVVPVGMRRALNLRDGGCRFAGCDRPASWCDAHHIRHWVDGGDTNLPNLILLCAAHHSLIHEGWRLVGDPNGTVWFHRPDGTQLDLASAPRSRPPTRGP